MPDDAASRGDKMTSRAKFVFIGFAAVAGYFLLTEHTAHVVSALPLLLFLSCPLMHLFMHHGHKHPGHRAVHIREAGAPERDDGG